MSPLGAALEEAAEEDVQVAQDDQRRRQDGAVVERHDQLVSLELPHLVGNGLHLKERVAEGHQTERVSLSNTS